MSSSIPLCPARWRQAQIATCAFSAGLLSTHCPELNMTDEPRKYEPRVNTADFLDADGDYTPDASKSLQLTPERQRIVDTVIALYNGKAADSVQDIIDVYAPRSVYDDIATASLGRA